MSAVASLLGLAVLIVALMLPQDYAGGNVFPVDRWALSVLAMGLFFLGYSLRREAAEFGVLAFFFIVGGGAQLYLTVPLWFPTLRLKPQDARDGLMMLFLVGELIVTLRVLLRLGLRQILSEGSARLGTGRIAIFLILSFAFVSPVINFVWRGATVPYVAHVAVGAVLMSVHLGALIAMSMVKSPMSAVHRLTPIVPVAFAIVASLVLGQFAFQHLPHVEDEVAYLFQAKTFAGGALTVPAPPEALQPGLDYYLFDIRDGRWFAATLPGWPAVLAFGVLLGVPWLINPLLAGASVWLAHDIARRKAGMEQADLVALMMASSPWVLAAAASFMPHVLTLFLMLLAWWLILRANPDKRRETLRLAVAGLAMGWIFATRPLDGLILGGMTGLWVLAGPSGNLRRAVIYALGCVLGGSLLLLYNMHITGSPLTLPLADYLARNWAPGANAYGFGPDIGPPGGWMMLDLWPGHTPLEALINTINMIASLQFDMLGWSVGSLLLIFAFLLWQKPRGFDLAMAAVIAAVIVSMALYWFADSYYMGPRYWFPASFALFYLSARGYDALRTRFPGANDQGIVRIDTILTTCCLFGLLVFTPWRGVAKYHEYGNFHAYVRAEANTGSFGNGIVIVAHNGDPGSALFLNDPWLPADRPLYLKDTGTLDEAALRAAFPGREIMHYVAPRKDGAAGPATTE
jgi:hypothetical protein